MLLILWIIKRQPLLWCIFWQIQPMLHWLEIPLIYFSIFTIINHHPCQLICGILDIPFGPKSLLDFRTSHASSAYLVQFKAWYYIFPRDLLPIRSQYIRPNIRFSMLIVSPLCHALWPQDIYCQANIEIDLSSSNWRGGRQFRLQSLYGITFVQYAHDH